MLPNPELTCHQVEPEILAPDSSVPDEAWPDIYQISSNGAGGKELSLAESSGPHLWPTEWSPDTKFILFASAMACALNIALNLWWVPQHGAIGSAWASG